MKCQSLCGAHFGLPPWTLGRLSDVLLSGLIKQTTSEEYMFGLFASWIRQVESKEAAQNSRAVGVMGSARESITSVMHARSCPTVTSTVQLSLLRGARSGSAGC